VILALLSLAVYLGVLAYATTRQLDLAPVVAILGGVGALLLVFMVLRRVEEVLAWALLPLGLAYVLTFVVHRRHGVDEGAPLVAAALLLCAELAAWSCAERREIRAERRVLLMRLGAIAVLVLAGLGIAALVLALAAAPVGGSFGWTFLGALAAVGAVALTLRAAR
jgi:hypothetical protein